MLGNNWKAISGNTEGQTQVSSSHFKENCSWTFPIDVHFATSGLQGWPKICIQVFHLDWVGRSHLIGYGVVAIPTVSGSSLQKCFIWRPRGNFKERFVQFFLGGSLFLQDIRSIALGNERYKLNTESMGFVTLKLDVILRNFQKFGVEYK